LPELILAIGTITMICLVYAIMTVRLHSHGQPPLLADLMGEALLVIGYWLNKRTLKEGG
jgi:xanthosine utilization system XapX-like protein